VVKDAARLARFEDEWLRRNPTDFRQNRKIAEALAEESSRLGTFRRADPLEGIETIIRVARAVNSV